MTAEQATLSLSGRRVDLQNRQEYVTRAEGARTAVAARPVGLDQSAVISATPLDLRGHVEALRHNVASQSFFNEGWRVGVVDLSRVCAIQPQVIKAHANERVETLNAVDIVALASVSLPVAAGTGFPVAFDPTKNTWIFSSSKPNLRVLGNFGGEVQPGHNGFGFMVGISTSFVQVALYGNRYLLRDGYHRAYGFLNRGITHVPAFVREFTGYEALGLPAGMLPQEAFLGERPPTLRDYLDDTVSADVETPATQKLVLIQATELSTLE